MGSELSVYREWELEVLSAARRAWEAWNFPPRSVKQVEKIELDGEYPDTELVFHAVEQYGNRTDRHEVRYPIWNTDVADTLGKTRISFPDGRRMSEPVNLAGALVIWFAEGSYPE